MKSIWHIFFWPKDKMFQSISQKWIWYKDWLPFRAFVEAVLWFWRKVCEQKKILFWTLRKVPIDAISCYSIGSLCLFHRKIGQRVRWPQSSHTCAFTQRHVPFIDWSSTQHTSVHTLVYVHTHFRREQREREPQHAWHSSYVRSCVRIQLGTIVAFRQVLIYLGWACSIWKHPQ